MMKNHVFMERGAVGNKLVVQSDMARSIAGEMQNVLIVSCDFYEKDNILY